MENNKYAFLNQVAAGLVGAIDSKMLEANIARLSRVDEKGTTIEPQLMPGDSEFMSFYLLYLLLARFVRGYLTQLGVVNPEAAAAMPIVANLAGLANLLKNGSNPFTVVDFARELLQDRISVDSYSLSGGFSGDEVNLLLPVYKLDFFIKLFPDVAYLSVVDNKVKTPADICKVAISSLTDTIKSSKLAALPDRPVISQRGDHLEFPI
jgi:hypothetical protein